MEMRTGQRWDGGGDRTEMGTDGDRDRDGTGTGLGWGRGLNRDRMGTETGLGRGRTGGAVGLKAEVGGAVGMGSPDTRSIPVPVQMVLSVTPTVSSP